MCQGNLQNSYYTVEHRERLDNARPVRADLGGHRGRDATSDAGWVLELGVDVRAVW